MMPHAHLLLALEAHDSAQAEAEAAMREHLAASKAPLQALF